MPGLDLFLIAADDPAAILVALHLPSPAGHARPRWYLGVWIEPGLLPHPEETSRDRRRIARAI